MLLHDLIDLFEHASKRHRLRLHASEPVRGECQHQPFLYNAGDLDLIPGGMADFWQQESESSALSLEVDSQLLERAAYELGQRPSALSLAPRHQFRARLFGARVCDSPTGRARA